MSLNRFVAASVVAAAAIGVPGTALAFGSAGQGTKSTAPPPATAPASKAPSLSDLSDLSALAASAGVTESQLAAGLLAAKQNGGNSPSGIAAFARAAGVSPATAQRIINSGFDAHVDLSPTGPSATSALATALGVSTSAAQSALAQIGALSRTQGLDPGSAAFAGIAHQLGVSPTRLAAALPLVKQALRPAGG